MEMTEANSMGQILKGLLKSLKAILCHLASIYTAIMFVYYMFECDAIKKAACKYISNNSIEKMEQCVKNPPWDETKWTW